MRTAAYECVGRTRPGGPGDALLMMAGNLRIQIHFTPDLRVVVQPRRDLVRDHRTPSHPPWHLRLGPRADDQDPVPSSTAGTTAATPPSGSGPPTRFSRSQQSNNSSCGPQGMRNTYARRGSRTVTDRLTACLTQPQVSTAQAFLLLREAGSSCCFQRGATQTAGAAPV